MKKLFLLFLGAFFISTSLSAQVMVPLSVSVNEDDMLIGNGHGKSLIEPPVVYIEDYTLSFAVDHPDYVLYIKDEDGEVVYTTTVYSTQKQVILPSTLAGDYQIELAMCYWLFTGWINL